MIEYDKPFEYPRNLFNSFETEGEGGQTILYRGWLSGIEFAGLENARARATIAKYVVTPGPDRRRFNLRKLRMETVSGAKEKRVWQFSATASILSAGKVDCLESYLIKGALIEVGTKNGIILSRELLVYVIEPMQEDIRDISRNIMRGGLHVVAA